MSDTMHRHDHSGHDHAGHGSSSGGGHGTQEGGAQDAVIRDPVCGMTVDPNAGKPTAEHDGRTVHFCSEGCRKKFVAAPEDYLTAEDPVCGMSVERIDARHMVKHKDASGASQRFYFCSAGCREKFEADPERYLGDRPAPEPMPAGTEYTCPMHPEIVQDHPGDCPKCGMALEPMGLPTGDEGPNPELVDFTRRLWVSAALRGAAARPHHGIDGRPAVPRVDRRAGGCLRRVPAGDAGRPVGGAAVLQAGLGLDRQPLARTCGR